MITNVFVSSFNALYNNDVRSLASKILDAKGIEREYVLALACSAVESIKDSTLD